MKFDVQLIRDLKARLSTLSNASRRDRILIAVAGPPASGKSTLAEVIAGELTAHGHQVAVVPMDGFHLDNAILEDRDLMSRKGAPETFDATGFLALVKTLKKGGATTYPIFDRANDRTIEAGARLGADVDVVLCEGNYLLLDEPLWRDLATYWDISIWADVPKEVLKERLIERWITHGFDTNSATEKALSNDIPNGIRAIENRMPADLVARN